MRKSLFVLVVLSFLVSVVPVSAQYIPTTIDGWWYKIQGNQVLMLEADNLGLVNQIQREGYRSLRNNLFWNGAYGAYGLPMGRGGFYPMYDRQMRPMSRREATATGAVIGAGLGYGVSGNLRGSVIGAAGGAIVGLLTHRGRNNSQRDNGAIVTPPVDQQSNVDWTPDGIPVVARTRPNHQDRQPVSNPPSEAAGDWKIANRTSKRTEIWDGERFVARIEPGQSVQVDAPQTGYKAVLLIPNRSGGLDQEVAQIRDNSSFNGWDILAPAVQ